MSVKYISEDYCRIYDPFNKYKFILGMRSLKSLEVDICWCPLYC